MLDALNDGVWQIVILDYSLAGGETAMEALASLAELEIDLPAILISGVIGEEEAADALRSGTRDFVNKGNLTRLVPAVTRELGQVEARHLRRESDEALLGYPADALLGMVASELLHPDDLPEGWKWGSGQLREVRMLKSDGSWLWIEGLSYEITGRAGSHFAVVARDISERKAEEVARAALEADLRQAQKMEAAGQLAGGMAHDFNNLLTVISGYTEILLRRLGREAEASMEIAEIGKAAARAAQLTRQLLAYSRKQLLEPSALDLNAVVSEIRLLLERLIGENIEFSIELAEDLGRISADRGQIEQVVMNLVVNARDAMPDGGKLVLATGNVTLANSTQPGMARGDYVVLTVTDTGEGMDAATTARIFEPYFTTKVLGAGTGLGLSMVHGIVSQSDGRIEVESEPGKGTSFRLYFPQVPDRAVAFSQPPPDDRPLTGTETILLVEDEEALRTLGARVLEGYGYTVLLAGDGVAGLELAQDHAEPIHVLMTDIMMPKTGGIELAERLFALHPELKILYTSGYGDSRASRDSPREVAGARYLQKPYRMEDLARTIRELIDSTLPVAERQAKG